MLSDRLIAPLLSVAVLPASVASILPSPAAATPSAPMS
jgi:hypothetical protein